MTLANLAADIEPQINTDEWSEWDERHRR